jgi:subtilisin family serine protease
MRMPRAEARYAAVFALIAAGATAAILATRGGSTPPLTTSAAPQAWSAVLGSNAPVEQSGRVIVVLRTPSLAQRVAAAGGSATIAQEQAWTRVALSAQRLLLARLAVRGVVIHPEVRFARVLDGFSAVVPADVVPIVDRDPAVAGVYPVRAAYPASTSTSISQAVGVASPLASAGVDGRGVTVAVLDTGVDRDAPLLRGRLLPQVNVVGPGAEEHGTEMAAVVARVARGASILPIRVSGAGTTSDEIIAGLERAVDPNGDGDAHDAVPIALVALAEPFAGFPDGPEAQAVAGARSLGTLVVAPSGNDGPAGAAYGDVAAPGGAPAALTVGAMDTRARIAEAHVVVRAGLHTLFDAVTPFAGGASTDRQLRLEVAEPARMFTRAGGSTVAGRAALVASSPQAAAIAGASAVLVAGAPVPAGGLGDAVRVPAVSLPAAAVRRIRARLAAHARVTVTIGAGADSPNPASDRVAQFSSTGLAFDGGVKPDLVAPGVAVPSLAGVTVSGTSAAAAVVAGDAALLAQARPSLGPAALAGLLAGTARRLTADPVAAQGAGAVDVGAAAAGELAASPDALALGASTAPGRAVTAAFTLTNLSSRRLRASLAVRAQQEGSAQVRFTLRPRTVSLAPGASAVVRLGALTASAPVGDRTTDGAVVATVAGGGALRVPWAIAYARPVSLISSATVSASGRLLTVEAGRVSAGGVQPVSELVLVLDTGAGHVIGEIARLRDLLPGRYSFALTGRGPGGAPLAPGRYSVDVLAYPVDGGAPSVRRVAFSRR